MSNLFSGCDSLEEANLEECDPSDDEPEQPKSSKTKNKTKKDEKKDLFTFEISHSNEIEIINTNENKSTIIPATKNLTPANIILSAVFTIFITA